MPKTGRQLMAHQKKALSFIIAHNGQAGLFMPTGTCKTLVAIRYAQKHLPALIICRRDDFLTWKTELELEGVLDRRIYFIESGKAKLKNNLPHWVATEDIQWVLVTYDLVKRKDIRQMIKSIHWGIAIADESQQIKRWKAARTKAIIRATKHIPRRIPMTGTPIGNDVGDVFTQCLFADGGRALGDSWWEFRNKYYIRSGPGWYLKHNAKDQISYKLEQVAYYIPEDKVMSLPPVRQIIKSVPMSGMQRRYYESVLNNWEIQLQDKKLMEINHVITQLGKLRQIAAGFFYDDNGNATWLTAPKLELLADLLVDMDYLGNKSKVVIWCSHTAEILRIQRLAKELCRPSVIFCGSKQNRKEKDEARLQFQNDKRIQLFIGQVDSGVGMNELVVSDTAVYYSNSLKVMSRQQSEGRTRRKGSERHKVITYWDLVTEGTTDEHLLKSIKSDISLATYVLQKLREGQSIRELCA